MAGASALLVMPCCAGLFAGPRRALTRAAFATAHDPSFAAAAEGVRALAPRSYLVAGLADAAASAAAAAAAADFNRLYKRGRPLYSLCRVVLAFSPAPGVRTLASPLPPRLIRASLLLLATCVLSLLAPSSMPSSPTSVQLLPTTSTSSIGGVRGWRVTALLVLSYCAGLFAGPGVR